MLRAISATLSTRRTHRAGIVGSGQSIEEALAKGTESGNSPMPSTA